MRSFSTEHLECSALGVLLPGDQLSTAIRTRKIFPCSQELIRVEEA